MKEIKIHKRKKEIEKGVKKEDSEEYWQNILNPYTSKPRFKNFLTKDKNDIKTVVKNIYTG